MIERRTGGVRRQVRGAPINADRRESGRELDGRKEHSSQRAHRSSQAAAFATPATHAAYRTGIDCAVGSAPTEGAARRTAGRPPEMKLCEQNKGAREDGEDGATVGHGGNTNGFEGKGDV